MKTIEMEIALIEHFGIRQNIIVPNISYSFLINHEADLIVLTKSNYAYEVEIKISKSDLKNDKNKKHSHENSMLKYLWFAVPKELEEFALTEIPQKAGLLSVEKIDSDYYVTRVKYPESNKSCRKLTISERNYLSELGCMRILGLKKKALKAGIK